MASKFHTEKRCYCIYGIVSHNTMKCFIGKTYGKEPKRKLSAHRRGECVWTRDEYSSDNWEAEPEFVLLESVVCTGAEAFKHVLAWSYFFQEHGYEMLNPPGVLKMLDCLHPETEMIYRAVCEPMSVERVCTREVVPMQCPKDEIAVMIAVSEREMTQINMRVDVETAELFKEFCECGQITRNTAMKILLSECDLSRERAKNMLLNDLDSLKQTVVLLQEENVALKKKHNDFRRSSWECKKECMEVLRMVSKNIMAYGTEPQEKSPPLRGKTFRAAKREGVFDQYEYPEDFGCLIVRLEHLVYSRGRSQALFILGTAESGDKIKLRWYDKPEYIGVAPKSSKYASLGAKWIVGYRQARDGAKDMFVGIPLALLGAGDSEHESVFDQIIPPEILVFDADILMQPDNTEEKKLLDAVIHNAERRRMLKNHT